MSAVNETVATPHLPAESRLDELSAKPSFRARRNTVLKKRAATLGLIDPVKFTAFIKKATKEFSEANNNEAPQDTSHLSPKAKLITSYMNDKSRDFGCGRENVAGLISLVIDEPIIISGGDSKSWIPVLGACIVMKSNESGHNYRNLPALIVNPTVNDYLLKDTGKWGNHPETPLENVRAATDIEIESFVTVFMEYSVFTNIKFLVHLL